MVLNVATGAEYTATRGGPALPRRPADRRPGHGAAGRAAGRHRLPLRRRPARGPGRAPLVRLIPRIRDIRRFGSCALDLCAVAQGSLDAYVEEGLNLWDHAAGGLVAEAAGARVETAAGSAAGCWSWPPGSGFDEFRSAVAAAGYLAAHGA